MVHELGHFVAAKLSGVKVLEFAIGFPPRIISFIKKETKYTIGLLPFGGYVQMLGENGADFTSKTSKGSNEKDKKGNILSDPHAFLNQSPGKRFLISIAGVLMNFVLAWLLLTVGYVAGMAPMTVSLENVAGKVSSPKIYVVEVQKDSPAAKAGLEPEDIILKGTDSDQTVTFDSEQSVSDFTGANKGREVTLTVSREGQILDKKLIVSDNSDAPIGIGIYNQSVIRLPWYKAPYYAALEVGGITKQMFVFLGSFFHQLFARGEISKEVGGPVAIFNLTGAAARAGVTALIQFMALLSINLGLINILPFPALDGGRLLFIILEKIFGKKVVKEEVEGIIHTVGFALLILLILAVTYKDVMRMLGK